MKDYNTGIAPGAPTTSHQPPTVQGQHNGRWWVYGNVPADPANDITYWKNRVNQIPGLIDQYPNGDGGKSAEIAANLLLLYFNQGHVNRDGMPRSHPYSGPGPPRRPVQERHATMQMPPPQVFDQWNTGI
jgi:hypothetical protein